MKKVVISEVKVSVVSQAIYAIVRRLKSAKKGVVSPMSHVIDKDIYVLMEMAARYS